MNTQISDFNMYQNLLQKYKVTELKEKAEKLGLSKKKKKSELIDNIAHEWCKNSDPQPPPVKREVNTGTYLTRKVCTQNKTDNGQCALTILETLLIAQAKTHRYNTKSFMPTALNN